MADSDDVTTTGSLVASTDDILSSQHDDLTSAVDSITEDPDQKPLMIAPGSVIGAEQSTLEMGDGTQMSFIASDGYSVLGAGGVGKNPFDI